MSSLSTQQLAELKKVFSIVDADNSGSVDASELSRLMRELSGAAPSASELDALMRRMDTDKDGTISFDEFVDALVPWLEESSDELTSLSSLPPQQQQLQRGTKRKAPPTASSSSSNLLASTTSTRANIHRRISNFFMQFTHSENAAEIRRRFAERSASADSAATPSDVLHASEHAFSEAEQLTRLQSCRELSNKFVAAAAALNSNDPAEATAACAAIADILSVVEVYPTPASRTSIADFLLNAFAHVREAGVISRVGKFLQHNDMPVLQYQAARVVSYYAPGPRIANTPPDSMLHPSKMLHKTDVVHAGCVHALVPLLLSNVIEVRLQAIEALTRVASFDPDGRELVLTLGAYPLLLGQLTDINNIVLARKVTWLIAILAGHTHPASKPPDYATVSKALPQLAKFLFHNGDDEQLLFATVTAFSHLLPGLVLSNEVCTRFVQLLRCPSARIKRTIMRSFLNMCKLDGAPVKQLLAMKFLPVLREILLTETDHTMRVCASELLCVIVVERGFVEPVLESDIAAAFVQLLNDEHVRWHMVKLLLHMSRSGFTHVDYLVKRLNLVHALADALAHFKSYDSVLRDVYHFLGPSYNFQMITDVIEALEHILTHGNGISFATYFDMAVVDKVRSILSILASDLYDQVEAWRQENSIDQPLHQRLINLLERIKAAHARAEIPGQEIMAQAVDDAIKEFNTKMRHKPRQRPKAQRAFVADAHPSASSGAADMEIDAGSVGNVHMRDASSAQQLKLKLFFDGDNRVLNVPASIRVTDLEMRIRLKYGRPLVAQYEDDEGDRITIDSPESLAAALARARDSVLKLHLFDRNSSSSSSSSAASSGFSGNTKSAFASYYGNNNASNPKSQKAMIRDLERSTHFSRQDVAKLHAQFREVASEDGRVDQIQFEAGLRAIGVRDKTTIDNFFAAFDQDKDGYVDFQEFVTGLSVMHRGTMDERLELAFRAYDLDSSGYIDRSELYNLLRASFAAQNRAISDVQLQGLVEQIFTNADVDGDGTLSFGEFKQAALRNQIILQSFWRNGLQ